MNANLGCLPKTSMTACSSSRRWTILEIYNASLASMMWAFHPSIQYLMSYKWYISYNLRRLQYIVWDELFLVSVGLKSLPVILGKIQTKQPKHHYGPVNEWQPINHLKFQPNSTDLPKIIPPCFVDRMFVENWGLLHKIVCFETYLPVGTFWVGRYISQEGKCTYSWCWNPDRV